MVLLNYEIFIEERLFELAENIIDVKFVKICKDPDFKDLMVKLYEYCQQINIIEQRMDVLAKETEKIKGLKPKLLNSEVIKIEHKTKQISSCYSVFLFKQPKFKIKSQQSVFYEGIIKVILNVLQKCFSKQGYERIKKQINRLIRTNTFNKKVCWQQFVEKESTNPQLSKIRKKFIQSDFKGFRRSLMHQNSEIRPYVNNRSSFRTKFTRSPMISLLYPTSQFTSFNLSKRQFKSTRK